MQSHQLDDDIQKALAAMLCASSTNTNEEVSTDEVEDENEDIINVEDYLEDDSAENRNETLTADQGSQTGSLEELLASAYEKDELVQAIIDAKVKGLQKLLPEVLKQVKLSMGDLKVENSKLDVKGRMHIPDDEELQLYLLQQNYDPLSQGHPGYKAMFGTMQANYFWPQNGQALQAICSKLCHVPADEGIQCAEARLAKPTTDSKIKKWMDFSLDFVDSYIHQLAPSHNSRTAVRPSACQALFQTVAALQYSGILHTRT